MLAVWVDFTKTKGPVETSPLVLTNPLNSCTKLQIAPTFQNNFFQGKRFGPDHVIIAFTGSSKLKVNHMWLKIKCI